ncbi:hypothetical protein DSM3645_02778 [Blastopirellula marina DSM 3645]|uniref:Uncharacterized protein n=1 Tax=Blastopirellula marina DSM 3645 TaxID=314230 RepID=A3ZVL9_9BACT|nr:hypothetical protein DSM3645_02778 [Blastopirellula marina DSM 3645]
MNRTMAGRNHDVPDHRKTAAAAIRSCSKS